MNEKDAKEYIEDCRLENGELSEDRLIEIIIWSYEHGWEEGIADYREERNPTDKQEWERTR